MRAVTCDDRLMTLSRSGPSTSLRTGPVRCFLLTLCTGPAEAAAPLRVSGERFVKADGTPFEWRGVTAFRLAELVAAGRERDADAYLAWAQSQKLTIVRVLTMAQQPVRAAARTGPRRDGTAADDGGRARPGD